MEGGFDLGGVTFAVDILGVVVEVALFVVEDVLPGTEVDLLGLGGGEACFFLLDVGDDIVGFFPLLGLMDGGEQAL